MVPNKDLEGEICLFVKTRKVEMSLCRADQKKTIDCKGLKNAKQLVNLLIATHTHAYRHKHILYFIYNTSPKNVV